MLEVETGFFGAWLEAIPGPNSYFAGWELNSRFPIGGCESESSCLIVSEGEDVGVTAVFGCKEPGLCPHADPLGPFLTVHILEGEGTVVSNPAGLECSGAAPKTCEAEFEEGSVVTLTASPAAGYAFKAWKGCDPLTETTGVNGRQCKMKMDEAEEVGVKFQKTYNVTAKKAGGQGKLGTLPGGIVCLPNCSQSTAAYKEGASVTVTAAPSKHWSLKEWTGACTGAGTCTLSMSADKEVSALFVEDPKFTLSLTKTGGGTANVKSKPAGLLCGYSCSQVSSAFYTGELVEVSWALGKGTSSVEWTTAAGTCTGKVVAPSGSCTVTMSSAKSLVAKFE